MVERSLSMREVPGSMPGFSTLIFFFSPFFSLHFFDSFSADGSKIQPDTSAFLFFFFFALSQNSPFLYNQVDVSKCHKLNLRLSRQ